MLPIAEQFKKVLPSDSLIFFGFIISPPGMTWTFQRASSLPRSASGFDFTNWRYQVWRGVLWSRPIIIAVTAIKCGAC